MARIRVVALVLLAGGALPLGGAQAAEDARQEHGTFMGQVKGVLYVTDVEKSAPYYRDVFGFSFDGFAESDGEPYYAEMLAGGLKFGLHEPVTQSQGARVGKARLYFRVKDVAAHHRRVSAWGGEPESIRHTDWMDMFIATDPDGNEIVFATTESSRHPIDPWGQ